MEWLALEAPDQAPQGSTLEDIPAAEHPRRTRPKNRPVGLEEQAVFEQRMQKHDPDYAPPGSTRESIKRSGPPAVDIEQQALRGSGAEKHGKNVSDEDGARKTRRADTTKRKSHGSPYIVPAGSSGSRPTRDHNSRTPGSHSSPLKKSSHRDEIGRSRFYESTPASEPRAQQYSVRQQPVRSTGGQPSSPTTAYHSHHGGQPDDLPRGQNVQRRFTFGKQAATQISRPNRHFPSAPAAAGPSRSKSNHDEIYEVLDDSDDDGANRGNDNDENQPPHTHPQSVSHRRDGKAQEWVGNDPSGTQEEGVDDIEDFDSSLGARPARSSAKGKEKAPEQQYVAPPTHAAHMRQPKQMQGKNGQVPPRDLTPPRQRKAAPLTKPLPSSNLGILADVTSCNVASVESKLPLTKLGAGINGSQLTFINGRKRFEVDVKSIAEVYVCSDLAPTFVVDFLLSNHDFQSAEKFFGLELGSQDGPRSSHEFIDLRVLFVLKSTDDSWHFFRKALGPDHAKMAHKGVSGAECLAYGPEGKRAAQKAAPEKLAYRTPVAQRAAQAAEARRGQEDGARRRSTTALKGRKPDPLQSTLKLSNKRQNLRRANAQPPRRLGYGSSPNDDDDGFAVVNRPPMSKIDKNQFLFHLHSLDITAGERYRFDADFLNDTCLEFGLRYTLDLMSEETRDSVHCFNSFFYSKLSEKGSKKPAGDEWPAYDVVKRWTRKTNVFDKKFIIVPVNESYHWYLAVIYNPGAAIAKARTVGPSLAEALEDDLESRSSRESSKSSGVPPSVDALESVTGRTSRSSGSGTPADRASTKDDGDRDPIDCIDESDTERDAEEDASVRHVRAGVSDLGLDAPFPQPIQSATLDLFNFQGTSASNGPASSGYPSPPPVKKHGRPPRREDYDILGSNETWIFTFDSLGSRHPSVATNLRKWLAYEARDKLKMEVNFDDVKYVEGKCLDQPNFLDCGLYLIHFVERILSHSDDILRFIGGSPRTIGIEGHDEWKAKLAEVWASDKPGELRQHWVHIIDVETAKHVSTFDGKAALAEEETAPADSQLSIQALSQPAPGMERAKAPAERVLPTVPENKQVLPAAPKNTGDPAPHSAATPPSTRRSPRVLLSRSPVTLSVDAGDRNDGRNTLATAESGQRSPSSHARPLVALSEDEESEVESEEEEPVEVPRWNAPHLPSSPEKSYGPMAARSGNETDEPPSEAGLEEVDELDDNEDFDSPNINPQLKRLPPEQIKRFTQEEDKATQVPGAYPNVRRMDHDGMDLDSHVSACEDASTRPNPPPLAILSSPTQANSSRALAALGHSPSTFHNNPLPPTPVRPPLSHSSPEPYIPSAPTSPDPFDELGTAQPVHFPSGGGGRTSAPKRRIPGRPSGYRTPPRSHVLVPSSSTSSAIPCAMPLSSGRGHSPPHLGVGHEPQHGGQGFEDNFEPTSPRRQLHELQHFDKPVGVYNDAESYEIFLATQEHQQPISVDDDSRPDADPAEHPRLLRHRSQRSRASGTPHPEWPRHDIAPSNEDSPPPRRRSMRGSTKTKVSLAEPKDEQSSPIRPVKSRASKPPSAMDNGKGRVAHAGRKESPHLVDDDSDVGGNASCESAEVAAIEQAPKARTTKPGAAKDSAAKDSAAKDSPPKANGRGRPSRSRAAARKQEEVPQVVDDSDDDEVVPTAGPSRLRGRSKREQSLEPPKPKRPSTTYSRRGSTGNKRRKGNDDQPTIRQFMLGPDMGGSTPGSALRLSDD